MEFKSTMTRRAHRRTKKTDPTGSRRLHPEHGRRPHCRPSCVIHVKASLTGLSGNLERVLALGRTAHLYEHKHRIIVASYPAVCPLSNMAVCQSGTEQPRAESGPTVYPILRVMFSNRVAFAYFVVFPMSLAFTTGINSQMDLVETYGVAQYFGFMFNIIIPLSLAFERRCRPVSDANRNIKPGYPAYDEALCLRRSGDHCGADLAARSRISPDGCHPAHRPV